MATGYRGTIIVLQPFLPLLKSYSKTHEGVSKLKYNRRAKDAMVELVEKIRPLRDK